MKTNKELLKELDTLLARQKTRDDDRAERARARAELVRYGAEHHANAEAERLRALEESEAERQRAIEEEAAERKAEEDRIAAVRLSRYNG